MLGDNRPSSCDSRVWGFVPRSKLIGPVLATYWPPQRASTWLVLVVLGVALGAATMFLVRRAGGTPRLQPGEPTSPPT
jgi:hypothetical protein